MRSTDRHIMWHGYLGAAGLAALLPFYFLYDPDSGGFPACPFHSLTGLYCTGCGSQRALHDLLHLDLAGVLDHNLLLLPALALLAWHGLSRLGGPMGKKMGQSPLELTFMPRVLLYVVLGFTVLRNLPWAPFRQLAP